MMQTERHPIRGIALALLAVFFFAVLDSMGKHLAQTFAVPLLVWARYAVHCLVMIVTLGPSMKFGLLATRKPLAQTIRALLMIGASLFALAALRTLPLAETTAVLMATPLLVALLASWLLREQLGWGRWLAILAGFIGTLFIARPSGAVNGSGLLLALAAVACYALYQIQTQKLSATENTITLLFYVALGGTVIMSLSLPWFWSGPSPNLTETLLIGSLGIVGGLGHLFLTRAFHHAPASILSPFLYMQIFWATILGWIFFDHFPDAWSLLGMAIITASGLSIALAARQGKRPQA